MTDWAEHLARGRRRAEALLWLLAAAVVALVVAAGAALAAWLDVRAGLHDALEEAVLIDLNTLPPAEALAEVPEVPQPEAEAAPPEEITPPEEMEDIAPPLAEAEPAVTPEEIAPPQMDDPPEELPQVVSTLPEPPPPPPKPKREVKRAPKPEKLAEAKPPAPAPQQASAPAAARKGAVSASEEARWKSKVSAQFSRQVKRKSYAADTELSLVVAFRIEASGAVSRVSLRRSSGNATVDAAVLAQLHKLGKVAAPPGAKYWDIAVPLVVR